MLSDKMKIELTECFNLNHNLTFETFPYLRNMFKTRNIIRSIHFKPQYLHLLPEGN